MIYRTKTERALVSFRIFHLLFFIFWQLKNTSGCRQRDRKTPAACVNLVQGFLRLLPRCVSFRSHIVTSHCSGSYRARDITGLSRCGAALTFKLCLGLTFAQASCLYGDTDVSEHQKGFDPEPKAGPALPEGPAAVKSELFKLLDMFQKE